MFAPPIIQELTGGRLHLSHGPIDIVLKAWGEPAVVADAYAAAARRFPSILPELCDELPLLRSPMSKTASADGPVARRMLAACRPLTGVFITPMAAVAGAVADELLSHLQAAAERLPRAFVNNGGDIAVHVAPGHALDIGVAVDMPHGNMPVLNGMLRVNSHSGIGGVATSGAGGRSFSRGIADAVTVLACDASSADAAATLVANAVNVDSPTVVRRAARDLDPDSDLGSRRVTVDVGALTSGEIDAALTQGLACARQLHARGLIIDAALMLAGEVRTLAAGIFPREPAAGRIASPR